MSENNPLEGGPLEPDAPKMGTFARLIGVFFEPTKTFKAIGANPGWDWIVPIVLLVAVGITAGRVMGPKIDVDEAVKMQVHVVEKMTGKELPSEARAKVEEQVRKQVEGIGGPLQMVFQVVAIFASVFIIAGIRHGAAAIFGAKKSYKAVLAGYGWVSAIAIIPAVLTTIVAFSSDSLSMVDVQYQRVLKSNVGAFLDWQTTHKSLIALASSIDIFDFWFYYVNSIALWQTTKFSKKQAFAVAGGLWGLYILLKVILGVLAQAFLG